VKSDPLRVALIADDFNPEWPSLPVVGFNYAKALADLVDVTVFTQIRNRPNIEKLGKLNFTVVYIDTEYLAAPIHKLAAWLRGGNEIGWTIQIASNYFPYLELERLALRQIKVSSSAFDIVHRITPMSPTLPSFASGRTGTPFVIGPLNGNLPWPREFSGEQQRERETLSKIKGVYKFLPFLRSTFSNASAILAAFPHTIAGLGKMNAHKIFDVPEIGYDPQIFYPERKPHRGRLTFLYAGRLVPYKLPEMTILAFAAKPELHRHRLRIVGSGPDLGRLQQLTRENGLDACVEFVGRLSQHEVAAEMRDADIFFFPSIRELGAGVVIEAMACGLPCIVADYGAPGALVNDRRGRKVPLENRELMVQSFAAAAVQLASDRIVLDRMSAECADYARSTFTWSKKATSTLAIYEWVLERKVEQPKFIY
jgi:glycosyltransferase involved in cell wall biosynthesis